MKKRISIILLIVVMCFVGCAKEEDVSSLNEYDMVLINKKVERTV